MPRIIATIIFLACMTLAHAEGNLSPAQQELAKAAPEMVQIARECVKGLPQGEKYHVDSVGPWPGQGVAITLRVSVTHGMYAVAQHFTVGQTIAAGTEDAAEFCQILKENRGVKSLVTH